MTLLLSDPEQQNTEEPKYFIVRFISNGTETKLHNCHLSVK